MDDFAQRMALAQPVTSETRENFQQLMGFLTAGSQKSTKSLMDEAYAAGWLKGMGQDWTVAIDFDGTIAEKGGWESPAVCNAKPMKGAFDFLQKLLKRGYKVVIFTARMSEQDPVTTEAALRKWFIDEGFPAQDLARITITAVKPPAVLYIDDRAYHFDGDWPDKDELEELTKAAFPSLEKGSEDQPRDASGRWIGATHDWHDSLRREMATRCANCGERKDKHSEAALGRARPGEPGIAFGNAKNCKQFVPSADKSTKDLMQEAADGGWLKYGTSAGAVAAWDTRGRSQAHAAAHAAEHELQEHGGGTVNLIGDHPTHGFVVAPSKETEQATPEEQFSEADIEKYVEKWYPLLQQPDCYLGLWKDQGKVYLDVSKVLATEKEAVEAARAADQIAIYDIGSGQTKYTERYSKAPDGSYSYKRQDQGADREGAEGSGAQGWLSEAERERWRRIVKRFEKYGTSEGAVAAWDTRGRGTMRGTGSKIEMSRYADVPEFESYVMDRVDKGWGNTETVPLGDRLRATQDDLSEGGQIHEPADNEKFPLVARTPDGLYHIIDGHHRIDAAIVRGDQSMRMTVVGLDQKQVQTIDRRASADPDKGSRPSLKVESTEGGRLVNEQLTGAGFKLTKDDAGYPEYEKDTPAGRVTVAGIGMENPERSGGVLSCKVNVGVESRDNTWEPTWSPRADQFADYVKAGAFDVKPGDRDHFNRVFDNAMETMTERGVEPEELARQTQGLARLSLNQWVTVDNYVDDDYGAINDCASGRGECEPDMKEAIGTLQSAIAKGPQYTGIVYRGMNDSEFKSLQGGDKWLSNFMSTSVWRETAEEFGKNQIAIDTNGHGLDLSLFNDQESEVILPIGTKLENTGKKLESLPLFRVTGVESRPLIRRVPGRKVLEGGLRKAAGPPVPLVQRWALAPIGVYDDQADDAHKELWSTLAAEYNDTRADLQKAGTSAGAVRAWDTRGRGRKEDPRGKVGEILAPAGFKQDEGSTFRYRLKTPAGSLTASYYGVHGGEPEVRLEMDSASLGVIDAAAVAAVVKAGAFNKEPGAPVPFQNAAINAMHAVELGEIKPEAVAENLQGLAKLSTDQVMAVSSYTDGNYSVMNDCARGGDWDCDKETKGDIKNLQSAIAAGPKFDGIVYRGMSNAEFQSWSDGKVSSNFLSTSIDRSVATDFADSMGEHKGAGKVVAISTEGHGLDVSLYNIGEREVILPIGAKLELIGEHGGIPHYMVSKVTKVGKAAVAVAKADDQRPFPARTALAERWAQGGISLVDEDEIGPQTQEFIDAYLDEDLEKAGTHAGAVHAWDTRGRGKHKRPTVDHGKVDTAVFDQVAQLKAGDKFRDKYNPGNGVCTVTRTSKNKDGYITVHFHPQGSKSEYSHTVGAETEELPGDHEISTPARYVKEMNAYADRTGKTEVKETLGRLDPKEAYAIAMYMQDADVNPGLREGEKPDAQIKQMLSGLNKLPAYKGDSYRGLFWVDQKQAQAFVDGCKPGAVISDRAFASSAKDLKEGKHFANGGSYEGIHAQRAWGVVVHIDGKSGRDIAPLDPFGRGESEVIFKPGTRFRVTSVSKPAQSGSGKRIRTTWNIHVKEV